jgi:phosphoadenosine phosphosulfate reductase
MHMLHSIGRVAGLVDFVTIDTLHLFPETYALIDRTRARYALDLKVYRPFNVSTEAEFNASFGAELWLENPSAYAFVTKVEPMTRALQELNVSVWITGRRRTQGKERQMLEVVEYDEGTRTHKVNPLCHWSFDQLWRYIRNHSLPYNALHDAGYGSVGDRMTTVVGANASDERGGRWAGSNQTECGMHTHLAKVKNRIQSRANTSADADDAPHLPCDECVDVDSRTFEQEVVLSADDVLLELYSPYCSHCQAFAPEYAKVAAALQHVPAIKVWYSPSCFQEDSCVPSPAMLSAARPDPS